MIRYYICYDFIVLSWRCFYYRIVIYYRQPPTEPHHNNNVGAHIVRVPPQHRRYDVYISTFTIVEEEEVFADRLTYSKSCDGWRIDAFAVPLYTTWIGEH